MAERIHSYRTRAVILRRRNYSDADRILTVFTPGFGKRMLIAKGSRKTTSRKAGHLELFNHVSLLVAQARSWDIITESVTVESFLKLRGDLNSISRAAYVCELVDAFTAEDDEYEAVWELLLLGLRNLDGGPGGVAEADLFLRWFELQLLRLMGFQPELFVCLGCGEGLQPVENFLHLNAGGVFCPQCGRTMQGAEPVNVSTLKILRHIARNQWDALNGLQLTHASAMAVESVLQRYLVTILEHRLKSTDFIHRLRQSPAGSKKIGDAGAHVAFRGSSHSPPDPEDSFKEVD
ncbi:MAG: DNA repair protein RecO [Caldilineaceae bacterium]|nr:DNA repair protein RecO [Caldilineaceae bacterium]